MVAFHPKVPFDKVFSLVVRFDKVGLRFTVLRLVFCRFVFDPF